MAGTRTPIYQPDFRVTLHKTVKRSSTGAGAPVSERFTGSRRVIDLTPFMSEAGGIRTNKDIRQPAGGFTVVLGDAPDKLGAGFESLYGLIEPMDFIEIRMRHGVLAGRVPVVMRGFVSKVARRESMSQDGKPTRLVVISGQDFGKLWQMIQILYLPNYIVGQDYLSSFRLFEQFGGGLQTGTKGKDLVRTFIEQIVNPYLAMFMPEDSPNPRALKLDVDAVAHGTTSLTGSQNAQGSVHSILTQFCDVGPWNELFIEDREDGVYVVFRPNPYRTVGVGGKTAQIEPDAPELPVLDISDLDVLDFSVERSDANVANYYWVRAPRFDMSTEVFRKQYAVQGNEATVVLGDYPNSSQGLYGIRLMEVDTQMGGDEVTDFTSGLPAAAQGTRNTGMAEWINDRRRLLVEMNKDNVVLEEGSMRITGNEQVRAGSYVRLYRGGFSAEYYVVSVDHDYTPFQGFYTTLGFIRGMGFVERAKRGGGADSPYLAELRETRLSKPGYSQ